MEKKKTYGAQLVENIEKNQGKKFAETREVTLKYGSDVFLPWIEENVIKNPEYKDWPIVWVLIMAKKSINENITNVVFGMSAKKPLMQLKCVLYSYEPKKGELKYHWILPQTLEMVKAIVEYSDGFDMDYVRSCNDYLESLGIKKK